MQSEKQQQAQNLFFQTQLSKDEIAQMLGISRRTMYYWAKENNWDYLKKAGESMPCLIANNCYQMMAQLSDHILSDERKGHPITAPEVEMMRKLTITAQRLTTRNTTAESVELMSFFMDFVIAQHPGNVQQISGIINDYLCNRAGMDASMASSVTDVQETTAKPAEATLPKQDTIVLAETMQDKATTEQPTPSQAYDWDHIPSEYVPSHVALKSKTPTQHLNRAARRKLARQVAKAA